MQELAAVIIETRKVDIYEVCNNHLRYLPKYTKLYVYDNLPINNINDYNQLMVNRFFWENIKEENILIFQSDSCLLREGIEDFYQFDYIGAPIKHIPFPAMNGGLSFRHKSAMLEVIEHIPYNGGNEDMYFCNGLQTLNKNLPTYQQAQYFSCETIFNLKSLGYHAIEKYLPEYQVKQIKIQYESNRD